MGTTLQLGCMGFSLWWLLFCGEWTLEHGLSSRGWWAQLPCGMWDLISLNRDWTCVPSTGRWILNHWATREVPKQSYFSNRKVHFPEHYISFSFPLGTRKESIFSISLFRVSTPLLNSPGHLWFLGEGLKREKRRGAGRFLSDWYCSALA